jgi:hypothetical protein
MPTAVKRLLLVAVLGALVVGATGCDLSPPAATVDGVTISQSTLNGVLSSEIGDAGAQCAAQIQSGQTGSAIGIGTEGDGTTPNAVSSPFAAHELETLVLEQLEVQTLKRHGLVVTGSDVAAAKADYESQLQTQLQQAQSQSATPTGCPLNSANPVAKQLPGAFIQSRATSLADQEMFEVAVGHVDVSPAGLRSYYNSHLADVTQWCLNVVVADTPSTAQTLHDQIAAGTSFPTAATAAGADQQVEPPGGQLPCEFPSQVVRQVGTTLAATLGALAAGQLSEPIPLPTQSATGASTTYYMVVQMRQRRRVPLATVRNQIRQVILGQHASVVAATLNRLVARAHISVDGRYGSWNPKHGVTVPTPPPAAFVANAGANVPVKPLLSLPGLTLNPAPG